MFIGKKREITGDLFNISGRIKEIDPDYTLYFDYEKQRFEAHHRGQGVSSLAAVIPFDSLDARTTEYIRQTRTERLDVLMAELKKQDGADLERMNNANRRLAELKY